MSNENNRIAFDVNRLPIVTVSVFADRADVKRKLDFDVEATGRMVVIVEHMAYSLDENSVRLEGNDAGKIVDVVIKKRSAVEDPIRQAKNEELRSSLKKVIEKEQETDTELQQTKEQRSILENVIQFQANQQPLENIPKFLTRHSNLLQKKDDQITQLANRLTKLQKEMKEIKNDLDAMEIKTARWSVSITLDVVQTGHIEMLLTYAVYGVSWVPSYSFRVDSNKRTMMLIYFGHIRQQTGENWYKAELRLISARYGVEYGQIPKLGNWHLVLVEEKKLPTTASCVISSVSSMATMSSVASDIQSSMAAGSDELRSVDVEVETEDGTMHCTFHSFSECIPSDGEEHQVDMLTHKLSVDLYYECVPRRALFAFAKASVINTIGYPLLPGHSTAYLDNSLVSTSGFNKVINARERFDCSLGIDPAISVEYKEAIVTHTVTGYFTKASNSTTFEQKTIIKNHRGIPIAVKLIDMIPNSVDDSVKVTLLEPNLNVLYKQTSGVTHSRDDCCLIWDLFVTAGKQTQKVAKYSIQYPDGKTLKLMEKAPL